MTEERTSRVNVQLDDEHAAKLRAIADRVYVQPGTIARSLLFTALDAANPDAATIAEVLDAIPGALERAHRDWKTQRLGASCRSTHSDRTWRRSSSPRARGTTSRCVDSNALAPVVDPRSRPPIDRTTRFVPTARTSAVWSLDRVPDHPGPWTWMLIVYVFVEADDRVVVVTYQVRGPAPPHARPGEVRLGVEPMPMRWPDRR